MSDKNEIRVKYKEIRKSVTNRAAKEKAICDKLTEKYGSSRSVFCYESMGSEVSTKEIIDAFLRNGARVCVPVVSGGDMLLKDIAAGEITDKPCELTIVPLLAFDRDCDRLGFGKGYYDRYLRRAETTSVGIAFAEQFCEDLPKNELDVPLSAIVMPDMILLREEI